MSTALGTRRCGTLGCLSSPVVGAIVHAFCPRCETRRLLNAHFGSLPGAALHASPSVGVQLPADRHAVIAAATAGG